MLRKRFVFQCLLFFTTRNVLAILSGVCVIRKLPVILSFVFCITRSMEWFVSQETDFLLFFFKWILYIENAYFVSQKCNFIKCILYHKMCVCYVEMFCFPKKYAFLLVTFSSVFCNKFACCFIRCILYCKIL